MMQADDEQQAGEVPLKTLLADLRSDALAFAQAKIALIRIEAAEKVRILGIMIGLIVTASVLAFGALIALLLGLIQLVTPMLGLGGAIASVILGTMLVAALLGWFAVSRIRALFARKGTA